MSRITMFSFDTVLRYTRALLVLEEEGVQYHHFNDTGHILFDAATPEIFNRVAEILFFADAEEPSSPPSPLDTLDQFLRNAPVSAVNLALWNLLLFDKIEQRVAQVGGLPALVYVATGFLAEIDAAIPKIENVAARALLRQLFDQRVGFVIGNHESPADIGWHNLDGQLGPSGTPSSNQESRTSEAWSELVVDIFMYLGEHAKGRKVRLSEVALGVGCEDMARVRAAYSVLVKAGYAKYVDPSASRGPMKKRRSRCKRRKSRSRKSPGLK